MRTRMGRYYSRQHDFDADEAEMPTMQHSRIVKGVKGLLTPKSPARFNFDHHDAEPRRERGRSLSRSRSRGRSLSRARSTAPRDENDGRNANVAPVRRSRSMSRPRQASASAAAEARSSSSRSKSTRSRTVKYKKKAQATVISELSSSDDSSPSSSSGSSSSSSEESDSHRRSRSSSRRSRGSSTTRSRSVGPAQDFSTLGEQFIHLLQKNFSEACTTEDITSPSRRSRSSSRKSGSKKKHRSSKDLRKHIIVQSRSSDDSSSSSSSSSSEEGSEDETRLEDLAKANLIIRRKLSKAHSRDDSRRMMGRPSPSQDLHRASSRYETAGVLPTSARSAHSGQSRQHQHQQLHRHPSNLRQRGGIIIDDEDGVFWTGRTMSGSMGEFDDYRQPPPSRRPPSDGYRRPTPMRRPPPSHAHSGDIPPQYRGGMRESPPSEPFDDRTIETRPTHEFSDYSFTIEKPVQSGGLRGPPVGSMHNASFAGGSQQPRMPLVEHNSYDGIGRISSSSPSFHQRPNHSLPDMPMRRGGGGMERRMPVPPFPQRRYERPEDNSCVSSGSHFQSRKLIMLPIPPGSIDFVLADTPNGPKVSWAGFASNLQVGDYIVGVENKDTRGLNSMVVSKLLNSKKRKTRVVAVRRIESDEI